MTDDEHALRELLHHSAASFDALDGTALRAAAKRGNRGRVGRFVLPAVVAASVAGIAGISVLIAHHTSPPAAPAPPAAATGSIRNSAGSRSAAADYAFRVRLVLPAASFPADGQPIHAYVLAINHTGQPVVIHDACNGWVQAGLTGGRATFGIINGDVACASKTLNQGTTRTPVIIPTTFAACAQGKQLGTPNTPHCLGPHDNVMPRLPPGRYRVVVETQSTSIRPVLPRPQPITLTRPR